MDAEQAPDALPRGGQLPAHGVNPASPGDLPVDLPQLHLIEVALYPSTL